MCCQATNVHPTVEALPRQLAGQDRIAVDQEIHHGNGQMMIREISRLT